MIVNKGERKFEVLLVCDYNSSTAATIVEHISVFSRFSQHTIYVLNSLGDLPQELDLNKFHVIVIHYSICIVFDSFISSTARERIRAFQGLKVVYIQDDYRWIYKTLSILTYMKVNAIFGLASQKIIDQVYIPERIPTVKRRETVLAGYVSDNLLNVNKKKYSERTIDVGYRARKLPPWIGVHSQQKWQIAERFMQDAPRYDLKCDISCREEDRIYGDEWFTFLSNCKSVLGTESGASLCDFTGEIKINVEGYLAQHPNATFNEISGLYFKDDCKIMMNVISPRCFEAAALGTLLVLYEGEYSGILKPYLHYVPLATDHHNMAEVVEYIRDEKKTALIVERVYNDVILNPEYSFRKMIKLFDDLVNEELQFVHVDISKPYGREEFNKIARQHQVRSTFEAMNKNDQFRLMRFIVQPSVRFFVGIIVFIHRSKTVKQMKWFLTKRVRIFNPLFSKIKNGLLSFIN